MEIFFGTISNDPLILKMVLLRSDLPGYTVHQAESKTATEGWNALLDAAKGADIAVLSHDDVYFPPWWVGTLEKRIFELPDSWIIAGFFGVNENGEECGKIHDRRTPLPIVTPHKLPMKALTVDGCVFVVNLSKGFRFEELPGHDLYDAYMSLRAKEMGGDTWIIDCMPEHYPRRDVRWKPDAKFLEVAGWLKKRFPTEKVVTTCYAEKTEESA